METTKDKLTYNFTQIGNEVVTDDRLSHADFRLYTYYKMRAGNKGHCWPSVKTAAKDLKMSDRTVKRAKAKLIELGYIEVTRNTAYGHEIASTIEVLNPASSVNKEAGCQNEPAAGCQNEPTNNTQLPPNNTHSNPNVPNEADAFDVPDADVERVTEDLTTDLLEWNKSLAFLPADTEWTPSNKDYDVVRELLENFDESEIYETLDKLKPRHFKLTLHKQDKQPLRISYLRNTMIKY